MSCHTCWSCFITQSLQLPSSVLLGPQPWQRLGKQLISVSSSEWFLFWVQWLHRLGSEPQTNGAHRLNQSLATSAHTQVSKYEYGSKDAVLVAMTTHLVYQNVFNLYSGAKSPTACSKAAFLGLRRVLKRHWCVKLIRLPGLL